MAALNAGVLAPDFSLPTLDGRPVSLVEALRKGPVVLAFFKVSCPVCQFAFPFLERVYQKNKGAHVTVLGISQDDKKKTQAFVREFGVSFPIALDNAKNYAVSNAYGLTNVPTVFYVVPGGEIEVSCVGWSKRDVEAVHQKLAGYGGQQASPLWRPSDDIPEFRAG
jgi:peroxiredoxin